MKKLLSVFVFILPAILSQAQSLERYVISSAGGSYYNGTNLEMDYTAGEVAVTTLSNANNTLTQGFQQPFKLEWVAVEENTVNPSQVFYFPNPVADELTVNIQNAQTGNYQVTLFNILGQLVFNEIISAGFNGNAKLNISCINLSTGNYYIRILHEKKVIHTGKIIKINQ
jgi:hypothetical protein